jgi:iron(III) transport system substrate-binding protein
MRILTALLTLLLVIGCHRSSSSSGTKEVVVYTSVDEPVARPILDEFTRRTGIKVLLKTDTEASKTAGLVQTLRAEKANPQADVFWNNEIFHTIALADEGLLAKYQPPGAAHVPAQFKDPQGRWSSNGLRLRMIAVGVKGEGVATVEDLAKPAYKGRVAIANPAFGTTSGHVAALFVAWGRDDAEEFLRHLKKNDVKLLGGNGEVVKQVAAGNIDAGLTDNDDVDSMLREGGKLKAVPARTGADPGTLAIPITVALIAGAKHEPEAKQLIDYLASPEVGAKLIEVKFSALGVYDRATSRPDYPLMNVDYAEVAKMMPRAVDSARKILEGRE